MTGISIGMAISLATAALGYLIGPSVVGILPDYLTYEFEKSDLRTLWAIHATVFTFSLVALSFAWQSVRGLSTNAEIISELADELRSIETITFFLSANVLIGIGLLTTESDVVTSEIGTVSWLLLVVSMIVAVRSFWRVFDLLLHNTLDHKVMEFAKAARQNKYGEGTERYDSYLRHFFNAAQREIDQNHPKRLREKLDQVEDLVEDLTKDGSEVLPQVWTFIETRYLSLHRRCVKEDDFELEKEVIGSWYGLYLTISNEKVDEEIPRRALEGFATLFGQMTTTKQRNQDIDVLITRYRNAQAGILSSFEDAASKKELESTSESLNCWFQTQTSFWRTAVQNEEIYALSALYEMSESPLQFRRGRYARQIPNDAINGEVDADEELNQQKQDIADEYREAIDKLRFATYGWAFKLYREDDISGEFFLRVFEEFVEDDFGNHRQLTEIFFNIVSEDNPLGYWERWNLEHELDTSHGAVMTGMAANTWLLQFYCATLVWAVDSNEISNLSNRDPKNSPVLEYHRPQNRLDKIIKQLESYTTDYPLEEFLDTGPTIEGRVRVLISYFESVKEASKEDHKEWIREQEVSSNKVESLADNINSQLESCGFRKALNQVGTIQTASSVNEANEFSLEGTWQRGLFVDDDISTFYQTNFPNIMEEYHNFVIEQLQFDERTINSLSELPDLLEELISHESVECLVLEQVDALSELRDDERFVRNAGNPAEYCPEFAGVPIEEDSMTDCVVVVLFDTDFEYIEEVDRLPITVSATPGEQVQGWGQEDVPEDVNIRDNVKVEITYRAKISSPEQNGVAFYLNQHNGE
ncbi:hypothetical protein [Halorientalis sp. IM1011]|uniref:hypothetical protein n=1 Tax=Halorientalis sp. IM1011 TaxID=1932360 RepID=UPI00156149E7|nr:hypothetical protein [Halorientalis sp. IM1011]